MKWSVCCLIPEFRSRYQITLEEATRFTDSLAAASHLVEPTIIEPVVRSDPDDDAVLYTAADGRAEILCTRNTRHFSSAAVKTFCERHGIRVMTDLEILQELLGRAE